ncbi:hypothetical protein KI387_020391 [Taxus chinensis]|uniref:Transcription factor-like protein DPB n=1 Tax=Taxus chinensis TaxID=29808 RepID=A0AA38LEZ0_TAXCH|nr:hypothetical protein KI387_020391 [Taxus chinensis]
MAAEIICFISGFELRSILKMGLKYEIVGTGLNQTMGNTRSGNGRLASAPSISNKYCLQNVLIREFQKAGKYDYAESLGIVQSGIIAVPNELWPGTRGYLLPFFNGTPARYSQFNTCPSVPLVSMDIGSIGSSSRGSDVVMAAFASNNPMAKLNHLEGDEFEFPSTTVGMKKRRRIHRSTIGEQGGRGLRHFSMKVCKKVESKGWTTYNEVASELVAEFVNPTSTLISQDQQHYDEKNIRRRVYDALNVLMAMDIITKEKKEIQWKGLPTLHLKDIEQLKTERKQVITRIEKKRDYLRELEEQITGLQNLMMRNERVFKSGNHPSGGVALPFILVKTHPHATVDIEISEDMQLVHFDFNSTFELRDDAFVLKAMRLCKMPCSHTSVDERTFNGSEFNNLYSPLYNCISSSRSTRIADADADADSCSLSSIPGQIYDASLVPDIIKTCVKTENFTH